jgi:hypothetical protein
MDSEVAVESLGRHRSATTTRAGEFLGYDLRADRLVVPTRISRGAWRALGPAGVCLGCYFGYEDVPAGTRTSLTYKAGPERGAHFAHPPGSAPNGPGLSGETIWHLESKQLLATWARKQPGAARTPATSSGRTLAPGRRGTGRPSS